MKTRKLLFSVFLFCGMATFATVLAFPNESTGAERQTESKIDPDQKIVRIGITGLQSGFVDIRIALDNGKNLFFTGSSAGYVGEFNLDENTEGFEIELNCFQTSPAFSNLTMSANFNVVRISDTKYQVKIFDKFLPFGEIGLHFGSF